MGKIPFDGGNLGNDGKNSKNVSPLHLVLALTASAGFSRDHHKNALK
jgi:hypothetical protein